MSASRKTRGLTVASATLDYLTDKGIADSCLFRFWTKSIGTVKLADLTAAMVEFQLRKLRQGNKAFAGKVLRPGAQSGQLHS